MSLPNEDAASFDRAVRLHLYARFLADGRPPTVGETAAGVGASERDVAAAYDRLAAGRVIVLKPGSPDVLMAAPLSAVPTRFSVALADGRGYYGNCIWDALGIPAMLATDARIDATCGECEERLTLEVRAGQLARSEGVVHFGVPAAHWWADIVFT